MKKVIVVAKWEFLQKVKSKAFIVSLIITPLLLIGISVLPMMLASDEGDSQRMVGVLDSTKTYFDAMKLKLSEYKLEDGNNRYYLINLYDEDQDFNSLIKDSERKLFEEMLDGFLVITGSPVENPKLEYRTRSMGKFQDADRFESKFNEVRRILLFEKTNIDTALINKITGNINLYMLKVEKEGEASGFNFESQILTTLITVMLFFFIIMFTGGLLIRSFVEEKSNRLIEIIISSCTPKDLLTGKILGLTLLVITQMIAWAIILAAIAGQTMLLVSLPSNIGLMIIFFLLGFVLFTAIFVGIGSAVNTEQEAQQINGYLSMILMIPLILIMPLVQDPNQVLMQVLSYIPFTAPTIMLGRLNITDVPASELIISLSILIASIYLTILVSSRIFRIGILSYGKLPSLKELFMWIKKPD